jgi:PAS domain S-box-containing protein
MYSWEEKYNREKKARENAERLLDSMSKTLYENNIQLEERLAQREKEICKTQELMNKYIITSVTDENGFIINISDAFCDLTEYSKKELIGQKHSIVKHPNTDISLYKELWNTVNSGKVWQGEIKNRTKSGNDYWVKATISPNIQDGEIVNFVSVMQNITSRKKLEETNDYMLMQSRHAAMGEMISMIAHQWRQPLSTIAAIANDIIIQKELEILTFDAIEDTMRSINKYTTHLSDTINDFRDFFMPNKNREIIHTKDIIDESIEFTKYILKSFDIKYTIDIKDNVSIKVYKNELIQVLINIIKNAKDQLVDNKIELKYINIFGYIEDDMYHIEIEDSGGGIPQDILPKIFEPYFSTKSKNGTGLGLYMSKIIIEEHIGGRFTAFNRDQGAVMKISIPLKEDDESDKN